MWREHYNLSSMKVTRKKLRNEATEHERIMWEELKGKKFLWLKFRRQHSVGRYILDFYCPEKKIWVELDWNHHLEQEVAEYDFIRTEYLEADGIKIYRILNSEIEQDLVGVLKKLELVILGESK